MRENSVKKACMKGGVSIGSWVSSNDALCAQIMANSGFDWLLIDMEHGPVPISSVQAAVTAIRTTTTEPFVRAAWQSSAAIQGALDCGVSGIMIPMINSASDAKAAVRDACFVPLGERSRGGIRHALSFQTDASTYYARANDEIFVIAQIETKEAINNLDEIAAVEGVDCLFVGPNDLAASFGFEYPKVWQSKEGGYAAAIDAVPRIARNHGKIPGILATSAEMANECIERGYTFVGVASDVTLLWEAARRVRQGIKVPVVRS